jgi:hypothetical protein
VNSPNTDEHIDDEGMRASFVESGLSINLRWLLIEGLRDLPGGSVSIESMLNTPVKFQIGWLDAVLSVWSYSHEDERYVLIAAGVMANRAYPESLRVKAATALFVMRHETRGYALFPRAVWDILHKVWGETDSGELHHAVGLVLKLQGVGGRL